MSELTTKPKTEPRLALEAPLAELVARLVGGRRVAELVRLARFRRRRK